MQFQSRRDTKTNRRLVFLKAGGKPRLPKVIILRLFKEYDLHKVQSLEIPSLVQIDEVCSRSCEV